MIKVMTILSEDPAWSAALAGILTPPSYHSPCVDPWGLLLPLSLCFDAMMRTSYQEHKARPDAFISGSGVAIQNNLHLYSLLRA